MSKFLRMIRKSRWYKENPPSWLDRNDCPADTLIDFKTDGNNLSMWMLEEDPPNLDRIIAALAGTRDHLANFDFLIFDQELLNELEIVFRLSPGKSADEEANTQWHVDLLNLSATKLAQLTANVWERGTKDRRGQKEIKLLIQVGIDQSRLDPNRVSIKL